MAKRILQLLPYFVIALSLYSVQIQALTLSASVDRTKIELGETLTLQITLDKRNAEPINFNEVELQFDIINRQRSSQVNIINGSVQANTQWTLSLAPKETGTLVIPSFQSEGVFSEPIAINVVKTKNNASSSRDADVFLEVLTDKDSVYVQEQVIYTIKLYYRISLSSYNDNNMEIDDAVVEPIYENTYQKNLNGITYNVLEKRYAIYPQQSGQLTIPQRQWQLERPTSLFGFGGNRAPSRRVTSAVKNIQVKPIPTASTASHWLPSPSITASQQWQQSIVTAKLGEPLNYNLTIAAENLQFSQLPTVTINSDDAFTVYTDQPSTENIPSATGISSRLTSHFAIIPKKIGRHQLPTISIKWWNTLKDKEEVITIDSETITVAATNLTQQEIPTVKNSDNSTQTLSEKSSEEISKPVNSTLWQWISLLLGLLLVLSLALLFRQHRRYHKKINQRKNDRHQISLIKEKNIKALYVEISSSIEAKNWLALRNQLLSWASLKSNTHVTNLQQIGTLFPALRTIIDDIDKALYSLDNVESEQYKELVELLKAQKPSANTSNKNVLTALYPDFSPL